MKQKEKINNNKKIIQKSINIHFINDYYMIKQWTQQVLLTKNVNYVLIIKMCLSEIELNIVAIKNIYTRTKKVVKMQ